MIKTLHLNLLGKPKIILGETPLTGFGTAKAEALLYYLAITGRPHSRETLADLLWGEMPEAKAKRNLTTTLSTLRKVIEPYLLVEPHNVAFNVETPHQVDATIFQAAIEGSAGLEPENLERDLAPLRKAVNLYAGDFLEGFFVKNALSFEEWVLERREQLRELMLQALNRLIEHYGNSPEADIAAALEYATQLLALDPWRESAHRQMMILLARSGKRSAALAQYETCRRILAEELGVEPEAETTALYERLKRTQAPPPHNLPSQPNPFVGRVREMSQLTAHLDNPDCRLITLVGPGGIGKTRLAIEAAARYVQPNQTFGGAIFPDGIYFVDLAPIPLPETKAGAASSRKEVAYLWSCAIADVLDFTFYGPKDQVTQLHRHLREKEMLLVLDNFEHLIKWPDLLANLLQHVPQIKLLVTSRERLNLMEEWVIELEGLDFPELLPSIETIESELEWRSELESFSAIALFVRQAQQIRGNFTLSGEEVSHIVRICQLVQGIPLALVLAASWLRVLSCAEIVTEIEKSLDFLSASQRNIPERHRSLRAVFEHSWQMLSDQEKEVFCKLSIFRGGFQRDAANQIAGSSLATLVGFVDKSLLHHTGTGRYEFHELLRQYAVEKLWVEILGVKEPRVTDGQVTEMAEGAEAGRDTIEAVWRRYSAYYLGFVSQQEPMLRGETPQRAISEMLVELDNIRQAWYWAVNEGKIDEIESSTGGLSRFYDLTGRFQEGEAVFGRAADYLKEHFAVAGDDMELTIQGAVVQLWVEQARLLIRRGLSNQAVQIIPQAVDMALQVQDPRLEAITFLQWGEVLNFHGEVEATYTRVETALQLARAAGLLEIEAEALRYLGIATMHQGDYAEAASLLKQSLACFQQLEDRRGESLTLNNLGIIARKQRRYAASQTRYEQALGSFREMGDLWGQNVVLNNLGLLIYDQGQYTQAQTLCQEGLQISREIKDYWGESHLLNSLGNILRAQGDYATAQSYYERCLQLRGEIGARLQEGETLAELALMLHQTSDNETARDHSQQAEGIGRSTGSPPVQALALTHLGHAQMELGELQEAVEAYEQALTLRQELGEPHFAIEALAGLTRATLALGDLKQAQQYVEDILPHLETEALYGTREPFRVHLTCYHVLRTGQDPRAQTVLETTQRLLVERAARIADVELQRSFLESVATHREIVNEFLSPFARTPKTDSDSFDPDP